LRSRASNLHKAVATPGQNGVDIPSLQGHAARITAASRTDLHGHAADVDVAESGTVVVRDDRQALVVGDVDVSDGKLDVVVRLQFQVVVERRAAGADVGRRGRQFNVAGVEPQRAGVDVGARQWRRQHHWRVAVAAPDLERARRGDILNLGRRQAQDSAACTALYIDLSALGVGRKRDSAGSSDPMPDAHVIGPQRHSTASRTNRPSRSTGCAATCRTA